MIIHVTISDITNGQPSDSKWCPVALAIYRQLGDLGDGKVVFVVDLGDGEFSIWVSIGDTINRFYHVPRSVKRFITKYDNGQRVKAFSFRLREAGAQLGSRLLAIVGGNVL